LKILAAFRSGAVVGRSVADALLAEDGAGGCRKAPASSPKTYWLRASRFRKPAIRTTS